MALRRSLAALALAQLLGGAACGAGSFSCTDDAQCNDDGALGTCQLDGWCSFPDIECPSGQRYGSHAGGGLADECVGTDIGSTTADSDDPTTDDSVSTSLTTSVPETCGNGIVDELEACDSGIGDATCVSLGFSGGTLECLASCQWDLSQCVGCGNGIREEGEACDGIDFGGQDCVSQGFATGSLQCLGCQLDTSFCTNCGNGMVDLDMAEQCDGMDLAGATCMSQGYFAGTLACNSACSFDTSQCNNCGNLTLDEGEVCEPMMLGGQTCLTLGYGDGLLDCSPDCRTFATMSCGALACNVDPQSPLSPECPPTCTSCAGNTCNMSCVGNGACSATTVQCPPGWACNVTCDGNSACNGTTVACPAHWACDVSCNDNSACSAMTLDCSDDGTCGIACGSGGGGLCDNVTLLCGLDSCTATCSGGTSVLPQCGMSCGCTPC